MGGTGLGLAIVQELVMRLGEEISVFNEDGNAVFAYTVTAASKPSSLPAGE